MTADGTRVLEPVAQPRSLERILIATDAWLPQVNGVVRTLMRTREELTTLGHRVEIIGPDRFRTIPLPSYAEIRLAIRPGRKLAQLIDSFQPCAVHISTEGPIGWAARRYCLKRGLPFTTAFHTKFADYVKARTGIPLSWSYRLLRRFHAPAASIMVATPSIEAELVARGFGSIRRWTRGVDTELFRPRDKSFLDLPRPIALYVGRVAVEKNIEAFLDLSLPGSKLIVGDGPQRTALMRRFPEAHFVGVKEGEELARYFAAADLFVFPSRTDTFGLVMLEALASGLPVAAYPVPGPLDLLRDSGCGVLDEDLATAARAALSIAPERCRDFALGYSWAAAAEQFRSNLRPIGA